MKSVPLAAGFDRNAEFSWGYSIEVTSFDPHRGTSGFDQSWLFAVYDRLVFSAPDGKLKPIEGDDTVRLKLSGGAGALLGA
ncbi:MAG: hypothetical protein GEV11_20185, partial [Streptosporangiales bacterium]|nr:hypothetical protein [Streptosporangiales bacterium]